MKEKLSNPSWLEPLGHGIDAIDTGFVRERFDAAYLIVEAGRAAYIDTGTNDALPRLLGALDARGVAPESVDYLILTHVHLDHAGAAGSLMQHLPNARLVVHPRGARHMINPGVLMAGVRAVYGEEAVARDYGVLLPVAPERVLQTTDGMTLELGGRPLVFIDTPGHARHHHCIWDEASRGWFTGDTFGLSYPELEAPRGRYLLPTTPPTQFEPEALKASVARLLDRQPDCVYVTHYGRLTDVPRLAGLLCEQIDAMVAMARPLLAAPERHERLMQGLVSLYGERMRAHGSTLDDAGVEALLAMDIELNAQGLGLWLDREAREAEPAAAQPKP